MNLRAYLSEVPLKAELKLAILNQLSARLVEL